MSLLIYLTFLAAQWPTARRRSYCLHLRAEASVRIGQGDLLHVLLATAALPPLTFTIVAGLKRQQTIHTYIHTYIYSIHSLKTFFPDAIQWIQSCEDFSELLCDMRQVSLFQEAVQVCGYRQSLLDLHNTYIHIK
jgi:hypothetical protein